VLTALLAIGCGDDAGVAVEAGPTGTMSARFTSPESDGAPVCVSIGDDALTSVPLLVAVDEIVLRPPGRCTFDQCGYLELYAGQVKNNEGAVPAIELLMHKIADRYHDGNPLPSGEPDVLEVALQIIDRNGEPLAELDESSGEDVPVTATLDLITLPDCSAL
jgi:hypothetical protein